MIEKYLVIYADEPDREWLAYPLSGGDFIISPPDGETLEQVEQFKADLIAALGE